MLLMRELEVLKHDLFHLSLSASMKNNYPSKFVENNILFSHLVLTANFVKEEMSNHRYREYLVKRFEGYSFFKILYLSAFLHDFGKKRTEYGTKGQYKSIIPSVNHFISDDLHFHKHLRKLILFLIENGSEINDFAVDYRSSMPPRSEIRKKAKKFISKLRSLSINLVDFGDAVVTAVFLLGVADAKANNISINRNYFERLYDYFFSDCLTEIHSIKSGLLSRVFSSIIGRRDLQFTYFDPNNPKTLTQSVALIKGYYAGARRYRLVREAYHIYKKYISTFQKTFGILTKEEFIRSFPKNDALYKAVLGDPVVLIADFTKLSEEEEISSDGKSGVLHLKTSYYHILHSANQSSKSLWIIDGAENMNEQVLQKKILHILGSSSDEVIVHATTKNLIRLEAGNVVDKFAA